MRCLLFACLFLAVACNSAKEHKLPTGVYLSVDSLTPGAVDVAGSNSIYVQYIDTSVVMVPENEIQHISIHELPGNEGKIEISFTKLGEYELSKIRNRFAEKKLALIINGELAGLWEIPADPAVNKEFEMTLITDLQLVKPTVDSLNEVWLARSTLLKTEEERMKNGKWSVYYRNGKVWQEKEFRDSVQVAFRSYYESGRLAAESRYYIDHGEETRHSKVYYEDGQLSGEEMWGAEKWMRSYYPDGTLKRLDSNFTNSELQPLHSRTYDPLGRPLFEQRIDYFDPVPGNWGEFNKPQMLHLRHFENGRLTSEGEFYGGCGECEFDSAGTWKFYYDGRLTRTKRFPSGQVLYRADVARSEKAAKRAETRADE